MFTVRCSCGEAYRVKEEDIGRVIQCSRCAVIFPIMRPVSSSSPYDCSVGSPDLKVVNQQPVRRLARRMHAIQKLPVAVVAILLCFALAWVWNRSTNPREVHQVPTGQIAGKAVFGDLNLPLSSAVVTVGKAHATTDWSGQFALSGLSGDAVDVLVHSPIGNAKVKVEVDQTGTGRAVVIRVPFPEGWIQDEFVVAATSETGKTWRWDRTSFLYWFNSSCSESLKGTVRAAFTELTDQTGMLFTFSETLQKDDAHFKFSEEHLPNGRLGRSGGMHREDLLVEADIKIDPDAESDKLVVEHEIFHGLGIGHVNRRGYLMQEHKSGAPLSINEINYLKALYSVPPGTALRR